MYTIWILWIEYSQLENFGIFPILSAECDAIFAMDKVFLYYPFFGKSWFAGLLVGEFGALSRYSSSIAEMCGLEVFDRYVAPVSVMSNRLHRKPRSGKYYIVYIYINVYYMHIISINYFTWKIMLVHVFSFSFVDFMRLIEFVVSVRVLCESLITQIISRCGLFLWAQP